MIFRNSQIFNNAGFDDDWNNKKFWDYSAYIPEKLAKLVKMPLIPGFH